jgi:FlaA1/EpsC-like NDP-sugar epimerase
VAGIKVYSPDDIGEAVVRHDVEQIVIAIPSATVAQKRKFIASLEQTGLPVKILPGLVELVDGHASVGRIRELEVSDLLGRDPVMPDPSLFSRNIKGMSILVTRAAGSIGSELCRQIILQRPKRLVLLDHSEFGLYSIDQELGQACQGIEFVPRLGSVMN